MAVSGRKVLNDHDIFFSCKPCKDRALSTRADGFCGECEVYMCNKCFHTHKQFKVCKDHMLTDVKETVVKKEQTDILEKCEQHFKEMIKFYCPQHQQVGCGDCMILEHKTCKVEYIRDKARNFKDSKEFKELAKSVEKCHLEANETLSYITDNKAQVRDVNEKFTRDVKIFQEEMIAHITKLTNAMLKLGEKMKAMDIKRMEQLEKANKIIKDEIHELTTEIQSQIDKPNTLFVKTVLQKPKIEKLREQLEGIRNRSKIEMYEFKRDENINLSVKGCIQLGSLQRIKQIKETELQEEEVRPKETTQMLKDYAPPKAKYFQPLLHRQLICRNINVDWEYLSYIGNGKGDEGLYVDNKKMELGSYVEVGIVNIGERGTIAIGAVKDVSTERHGWGAGDVRFQAWDGKLYVDCRPKRTIGKICSVGDRIGCGLEEIYGGDYVVFTRNGKKIAHIPYWVPALHIAVWMHSSEERVKVILDAKMPTS